MPVGCSCRVTRGVARADLGGCHTGVRRDRNRSLMAFQHVRRRRESPRAGCVQSADFVVTGCHAAFFTSYSVELGFFRSPVFVNAIVPVMPS